MCERQCTCCCLCAEGNRELSARPSTRKAERDTTDSRSMPASARRKESRRRVLVALRDRRTLALSLERARDVQPDERLFCQVGTSRTAARGRIHAAHRETGGSQDLNTDTHLLAGHAERPTSPVQPASVRTSTDTPNLYPPCPAVVVGEGPLRSLRKRSFPRIPPPISNSVHIYMSSPFYNPVPKRLLLH